MSRARDLAVSPVDPPDDAGAIVPGISPQVYSRSDFDRIARLMREGSGIVLSDDQAMAVYARIAPLVRASAATQVGEFLDWIDQNTALRAKVIEALTTNRA
jgi:hypothetical protein